MLNFQGTVYIRNGITYSLPLIGGSIFLVNPGSVLIINQQSLVGKNKEFKELHDYYTHRPENPLKKKQSLVAVACKFLRVAYKILTTGVDYDAGKMLNDIKRPQKQLQQAA